jgi:hypothetical protein
MLLVHCVTEFCPRQLSQRSERLPVIESPRLVERYSSTPEKLAQCPGTGVTTREGLRTGSYGKNSQKNSAPAAFIVLQFAIVAPLLALATAVRLSA